MCSCVWVRYIYFYFRRVCEQKRANWAPITQLKEKMLSYVADTSHSQKKICLPVTIQRTFAFAIVFSETYYLGIASKEMCPGVYFLTTQQIDVSRFRTETVSITFAMNTALLHIRSVTWLHVTFTNRENFMSVFMM